MLPNKTFIERLIEYNTRQGTTVPTPDPTPTPPVDSTPETETMHAEIVRLLAGSEAALVGALDAVRRARGLLG
jgi:hypothetical protein